MGVWPSKYPSTLPEHLLGKANNKKQKKNIGKRRNKSPNPKNSSITSRDGKDAGERGFHTNAHVINSPAREGQEEARESAKGTWETTMGSGEATDDGDEACLWVELTVEDRSNSKIAKSETQSKSDWRRRCCGDWSCDFEHLRAPHITLSYGCFIWLVFLLNTFSFKHSVYFSIGGSTAFTNFFSEN